MFYSRLWKVWLQRFFGLIEGTLDGFLTNFDVIKVGDSFFTTLDHRDRLASPVITAALLQLNRLQDTWKSKVSSLALADDLPRSAISSSNLLVDPRSKSFFHALSSLRNSEEPLEPFKLIFTVSSVPAHSLSDVTTSILYLVSAVRVFLLNSSVGKSIRVKWRTKITKLTQQRVKCRKLVWIWEFCRRRKLVPLQLFLWWRDSTVWIWLASFSNQSRVLDHPMVVKFMTEHVSYARYKNRQLLI